MITPLLEKLILKGEAQFQTMSHAFGMLERFSIPTQRVGIITKIIWWNFMNRDFLQAHTWNELFNRPEYQLRIESENGQTWYHFRNTINWTWTDPLNALDLSTNISDAKFNFLLWQPGPPVQIDTYIPVTGNIKSVVSRNAIEVFTNNEGNVNAKANEQNAPNGVGNLNLLLRSKMQDRYANYTEFYAPPSDDWTGLAAPVPPDRNFTQGYKVDYMPRVGGGTANSELSMPGAFSVPSAYVQCPLVTYEMVTINKNAMDSLQRAG